MMKFFKIKKSGQTLIEFVLIGSLVMIVSFWTFLKLNPAFFRSFTKGSLGTSTVNMQGQMEMQAMGD